jgi:hypothetical protein
MVTYSSAGKETLAAFLQLVSAALPELMRGLQSFLCHKPFNHIMTGTNFASDGNHYHHLPLGVCVAREPIDWHNCHFVFCAQEMSWGSFCVPQTFKSHQERDQPVLHVSTKPMETITIMSTLVDIVREPIVWCEKAHCLVC